MSLSKVLLASLSNPKLLELIRGLDAAEAKARAWGVGDQFEVAWRYEAERSKQFRDQCLDPSQILRIVISYTEAQKAGKESL